MQNSSSFGYKPTGYAKNLLNTVPSTGTVTNVTASLPLTSTGGTTPNLAMVASGVTPGSYTVSTITVNSYGLVTAAATGSAVQNIISGPSSSLDVIGTSSPYGAPVSTSTVQTTTVPTDLYYLSGQLRKITSRQKVSVADSTPTNINLLPNAGLLYPLGTSQAWAHVIKLEIVCLAPDSTFNQWELEFTVRQSTSDVLTPQTSPILWRSSRADYTNTPNVILPSINSANFFLQNAQILAGQINVVNWITGAPTCQWFLNTEVQHFIY
jgi:hypothetical protein